MPQMVEHHISANKLPEVAKPCSELFSSSEFIGVEMEFENCPVDKISNKLPSLVTVIEDGSLKWHGSEIIFSQALCGDNIIKAIRGTFNTIKELNIKPYVDGNRCSLHIHINITDLTINQLYNFVMFSYFCEPALLDTCSKDRRYNAFSVGIERTYDFVFVLEEINKRKLKFGTDYMKYRAIGLNSIYSLGSLEFRMFNGTTDAAQIIDWINFVQEIKSIAINHTNIKQAILDTMKTNPDRVMDKLFDRKIELTSYSRSCMWNYARDFYARQSEGLILENKFSDFYKQISNL